MGQLAEEDAAPNLGAELDELAPESDDPTRGLPPGRERFTESAPARHALTGYQTIRRGAVKYLARLNPLGFVFFAMSLAPSLLPRSWPVQGLLSGISFVIGHALGSGLAALLGMVIRWRPSDVVRRRLSWAVWIASGISVVVMLWLGSAWQSDVRRAVGMPPEHRTLYLGVLAIAVLIAAVLLWIGRLLRALAHWITRMVERWLPRPVALGVGVVLTALLTWGVIDGVVLTALRSAAESTFELADERTNEGDVPPTSPLRSAGPSSLVTWDELGREGRTFVATGPSAREISELTGRPALAPIRVYAGRESADTLKGEAAVVMAELQRTRAFERKVLAVAVTTGSGWIAPWQAGALEYMEGGDTAIASMQYSYFPSWISFLIDRDRALEAGRVLFSTVYDYWSTLPAQSRPRLVLFGESLGAYGGNGAFVDIQDMLARTQGALFTGPPNSTKLWRRLTDQRVSGSPEVEPVWSGGDAVRFTNDPASLRRPDGTLPPTKVIYIQHPSDPITWFSPSLLWSRPDWLAEPRGSDVVSQMHYIPLVTFWQVTLDMIGAVNPPDGHGHSFGSQVVDGWAAVLQPANWSAAETARLIATGMPTSSP